MSQRTTTAALTLGLLATLGNLCPAQSAGKPPVETRIEGPNGLTELVRMQGPSDADVPLQVVCYFTKTATSDANLKGAPVELDEHLGGLIGSLRDRGEFGGEALETILIDVPEGTIKPGRLLLIGLGDESSLSLERMEQVGRVALREAVKLGAVRVAFAPLIRDQGSTRIGTGDIETAVVRGMLLAYDTEKRLQAQGFAKPFTLETWIIEAGPSYYDETVKGVRKANQDVQEAVTRRESKAYSRRTR